LAGWLKAKAAACFYPKAMLREGIILERRDEK